MTIWKKLLIAWVSSCVFIKYLILFSFSSTAFLRRRKRKSDPKRRRKTPVIHLVVVLAVQIAVLLTKRTTIKQTEEKASELLWETCSRYCMPCCTLYSFDNYYYSIHIISHSVSIVLQCVWRFKISNFE